MIPRKVPTLLSTHLEKKNTYLLHNVPTNLEATTVTFVFMNSTYYIINLSKKE